MDMPVRRVHNDGEVLHPSNTLCVPPPEVSDVVAGSAHLVHAPAGVRGAGVVPRASEMSDHTLNCQY